MSNPTILPPAAIVAWPNGLPDVADPSFRQQALIWVRHLTTVKVGEFNAAQDNVNHNAQAAKDFAELALQRLDEAAQQKAMAEAAAQAAATSAQAAGKASGASNWIAGGGYEVNDVVWGVAQQGVLFRCVAAHSGQTTPPEEDTAHWVPIGARTSYNPVAGASRTAIVRNGSGQVERVDFTVDGKAGSTTIARNGSGIASTTTTWDGRRRIETITRDAQGRIASTTATEEAAP